MRSFESQSAWQYILVYISGTMSVILVRNPDRDFIWVFCMVSEQEIFPYVFDCNIDVV